VDPGTKPHDLGRPGHVFPLKAKNGGVLRRTGHTEAAVDLARLAGFEPAGILVEILNEDGTMARLPQLLEVANKFDLKIIAIEDLVAYRMQHDSLIAKKNDFEIETRFGTFRLRAYQQTTNDAIHMALTKGEWDESETIPIRINSTSVNNDILGTLTNNVDRKLDEIFKLIESEGKGAVVFINQYTSPEKTLKRLTTLETIQNPGEVVKAPSIEMDAKDFGIGAQILHDLSIHKLNLISNSKQKKRVGMIGYGLEIVDYINY
jgi:3,4-dihydroxy 2-butanone 4-phosphate synthase/GTP cyclohydrolase II